MCIHSDIDCLVFDFFKKFSRFEYALKQKGYACMRGNLLVVDYNRFYEDYNDRFDDIKSAQTMLELKPKQQVLKGKSLEWSPRDYGEYGKTVKGAVEALKQVRNNLFHGGKYMRGGRFEKFERTKRLLLVGCEFIDELVSIANLREYVDN